MSRTVLALAFAVALAASATAQSSPADPASPGPHLVRSARIAHSWNGKPFPVELRLPAAPSFARPTLLFVHGWSASPTDYTWLANHLASRGFAVALYVNENRFEGDPEVWAAQARAILDSLARANADPRSEVFGELDLGRLGVIGHSYGGATTIATAATDPRVRAAVALEPGTDRMQRWKLLVRASQVRVPLLVVGGEFDTVVPAWRFARPAFELCPAPQRLYVEIARANHMNVADVDLTTWHPTPFGPRPSLPAADLHRVASRYFTAWLERFIANRPDPDGWTDGRAARREVQVGILSRSS